MEHIPKKILICEDHQIVIDGLLSIFNSQSDFEVIDYLNTGESVIEYIKINKPEILLLDLNLPKKNGLEVLKEVKLYAPDIKVIILTMYNKESIIKKVKSFNGNGFLLKNCSSEDLLNALNAVFETNTFYLGKGVKNNIQEVDGFIESIKITRREKEIISELIQGKNVPQIAEKLFISAYTVETHKKNVFKKLDIHNTIDLVKLVNEKSLLS